MHALLNTFAKSIDSGQQADLDRNVLLLVKEQYYPMIHLVVQTLTLYHTVSTFNDPV